MKQSLKTIQEHADRVVRKQERLHMVQALIFEYERRSGNEKYLQELYKKEHALENQLKVMAR